MVMGISLCVCDRHLDQIRAGPGSPGPAASVTRIHDFAQHCVDKAMHTKRMEVTYSWHL